MFNSWKRDNESQHPSTETLEAVKGHIDMEVKHGATIQNLTNILVQKYLNVDPRQIKIIFFRGINDVIQRKHAHFVNSSSRAPGRVWAKGSLPGIWH